MHTVVAIGIRLLEGIFIAGILGSTLVVILAGIEDVRETLKKEEPQAEAAAD